MVRIILASKSPARGAVLCAAGIGFETLPSRVDERQVEAPLLAAGRSPGEIAMALAEAKAIDVAASAPDALVIGADQTLDADGERWVKPETMEAAREQLLTLAGRTHHLQTAVVGVRDGAVRWRHLESAAMTMRPLSAAEVDRYLASSARRRWPASAPIRSRDQASSSSTGSTATISRSSDCRSCRCSNGCGRRGLWGERDGNAVRPPIKSGAGLRGSGFVLAPQDGKEVLRRSRDELCRGGKPPFAILRRSAKRSLEGRETPDPATACSPPS